MLKKRSPASARKKKGDIRSLLRKIRKPFVDRMLILLLFLSITLPHLDFQPFWDASLDLSHVSRALHAPTFSLLNFRLYNHPSIVYLFLLYIPQLLWRNLSLYFLTNVLLVLSSMLAFLGIVKMLWREGEHETEALLATAIFGLAPLYVAHIFHVVLDFGLAAFFTIYLYFLLRKKLWWANVFALAMCFTKETAVPMYLGTVGIFLLIQFLQGRESIKNRLRKLGKSLILLVPLLVVGAYFGYIFLSEGTDKLVWHSYDFRYVDILLDFNLLESSMRAFLANTFILNFNWIPTSFLFLALLGLWFGKRDSRLRRIQGGHFLFLVLTLILVVYCVSRVRFFNNARYMLPTYPVLLSLFPASLLVLIERKFTRILILSVTLVLIVLSNFRTIDPISRKVYGTFDFGDHQMLNMISFFGTTQKDQMVYSLEFMNLETLANEAAEDLGWRSNSTIFTGDRADFWWPFAIQSPKGPIRFSIRLVADRAKMSPEELQKSGESVFYFLAFPNLHNEENLAYLLRNYPSPISNQYEHNGYRLTVYTFNVPLTWTHPPRSLSLSVLPPSQGRPL